MVDENKVLDYFNLIKKIFIIGLVLGIVIFVSYKFLNGTSKSNLEDYLKKEGYKEEYNVWTKEIRNEENDSVSLTNYLYDPKINKFLKETKTNYNDHQEQISIKYNGTDKFESVYSYDGADCNLVQSAEYNYKNHKFKCNVDYNPKNCIIKCNILRQESKKFAKELDKIMKESGTVESFLVQNKD